MEEGNGREGEGRGAKGRKGKEREEDFRLYVRIGKCEKSNSA